MQFPFRVPALVLPALALLATPPVVAQDVAAPPPPAQSSASAPLVPATQGPDTPWLFRGSDIPPDRSWTFGVLPNGVRYAVRKNGVPPGQVAIRVGIEAGSLMESERERGYAHLLEHLSFRGSEHVPDGESKRVWQRLGVTFGSDSNASTSFTQTVYKLDLPGATPQGLDESMKILAGMMTAPTITDAALDAERPVVLSEQREQPGPQVRLGDAARGMFFTGQPLADRSPIGTPETLQAATAQSVAAFHSRWYRPDRAVVVVVGDADPALLEAAVKKHFSGWQARSPKPVEPDFGMPRTGGERGLAVVEPSVPPLVQFAVVRPWTVGDDTILFNQERMIDMVAIRLINRRLETRARSGAASYITASADLEDVSRSANITAVSILPLGEDWEAGLRDVRSTIQDAIARAPTQAEIDREVAEIRSAMQTAVATQRVQAGAKLADDMMSAVDIRETIAGPETSLKIFEGAVAGRFFTPARVQAATKKVFTGVETRAMVNTRTADQAAGTKLLAALEADVAAAAARADARPVTFDRLPRPGKPGVIAQRRTVLAEPDIEQVDFANGTKLLLFPNDGETGKVYVRVRFGRGMQALRADRSSTAFAAPIALVAGGIGKLGQEELDRLTSGRQIGLGFEIDDDAFALNGITTPADLPDQLRLMAAKLETPRWDAQPVARARAVLLAGYDGRDSSPSAVLQRDLEGLLRAGDPRWTAPTREQIDGLNAKAFRAEWEPLLKSGPIEVQVFGDIPAQVAVDAVARSFGAMKPRAPAPVAAATVRFPAHVAQPVTRTHSGQPNQGAAVIAWPTGGGSDALSESRKLEILAAVFRDRLLDRLRSQAGISYSPTVVNNWPVGQPGGGRIMALGLVPPDKTAFFFQLAREIAADLVATPVALDELRRSLAPVLQSFARMSSGNMFWMQQSSGGTIDPKRIEGINTLPSDLGRTTPGQLQALAAKYLTPEREWSMVVVPETPAK